ncbi:MAG: hypothetical protein IPK71_04210 [Myxococcales bacterium]|nr:hypothetical protein [Myxococcales bacterium]
MNPSHRASLSLAVALTLAACGGKTEDLSGTAAPGSSPSASSTPFPGAPPPPGAITPTDPPLPTSPFTARVATTDVSILYPLPERGTAGLLRASDGTGLGPLLPREAFSGPLGRGSLDFEHTSTYEALHLVGVRLDPCGHRAEGAACTSEVRAVFQGVAPDTKGATLAADGGVHVMYDVPAGELDEMLREILTAKRASGDTESRELGPHPILTAQGLEGAFGKTLRAIVLRHVGEKRIARVTTFDHNFALDGDGWTFTIHDRVNGKYVAGKIPGVEQSGQTVGGTPARALSLAETSAEALGGPSAKDPVAALVSSARREAPAATLQKAFDSALRVEDPSVHTAASTDCANCHLAEGAHRIGKELFGMNEPAGFLPGVSRRDERTSVTNLHAFGYLDRSVSITLRTAAESVDVARGMERTLVAK